MNRRNFINSSLFSAIATSGLDKFYQFAQSIKGKSAFFNPQITSTSKIIPPLLLPGDTIAISAAASPTSTYEIRHSKKFFEAMGCKVIVGNTIKHIIKGYRYLSDSDENRAGELNQFVSDESVKMILFARGGYGTMRMLDYIDYSLVESFPKIMCGFSDITALLNAITNKAKIVTYHGPVGISSFGIESRENFEQILFTDSCCEYLEKNAVILNPGEAEGELIGGNLRMVTSLIGTKYEPDFTDKIVFFEEVYENPYKIDRMLTQLIMAGKFERAKAVIFGDMGNLNKRHSFYPYKTFTIKELLEEFSKKITIPVSYNHSFGHIKRNLIIPIGMNSLWNSSKKSLRFIA